MSHTVSWFEIPANDLARAKRFYESILQIKMVEPPAEMNMKTAFFPADWQHGEIRGSIAQGENEIPAAVGTLVFLNAGDDLSVVLDRIPAAGGQVVVPKMQIPMKGAGYMALFLDTEGNKVGLTSPH